MKTPLKVLLVTLLFGLPTIPLGRVLWPDPLATTGGMAANVPSTPQLAMLIGISLFEAISFGLGVAFLIFALPLVRRAAAEWGVLAPATYAAIAWALLSWWPHDNLHRITSDVAGLITIEYAFHTTLILSAALIAASFLRLLARALPAPATARPQRGAAPAPLGVTGDQ